MTISPSKDAPQAPIFLVGAGRSGTTWLQTLIAQHPYVATAPETQVFARYLGLLERRWEQERQYRQQNEVRTGIQDWLAEADFDELLGGFAATVFARIQSANPSARLVLEKSPNHVLWIPLIHRCFPEARFIHLVRDPRAVVASNRAAAASWGKYWASAGTLSICDQWCGAISAARTAADSNVPLYELRYEDLVTDTTDQLQQLLSWLNFPAERQDIERFVESCQIERLRTTRDDDKAGDVDVTPSLRREQFYRRGTAEGWRDDLNRIQIAAIEHETADLMSLFGYEPIGSRLSGFMAARSRRCLKRLASGLRWRVNGALTRIDESL